MASPCQASPRSRAGHSWEKVSTYLVDPKQGHQSSAMSLLLDEPKDPVFKGIMCMRSSLELIKLHIQGQTSMGISRIRHEDTGVDWCRGGCSHCRWTGHNSFRFPPTTATSLLVPVGTAASYTATNRAHRRPAPAQHRDGGRALACESRKAITNNLRFSLIAPRRSTSPTNTLAADPADRLLNPSSCVNKQQLIHILTRMARAQSDIPANGPATTQPTEAHTPPGGRSILLVRPAWLHAPSSDSTHSWASRSWTAITPNWS